MSTATTLDIAALSRAIEERDAARQLAHYADDAQVRLVDRNNPPHSPRVLRGREAIREWIEDVCARDMTHRVSARVAGPAGAAFVEECRYPDGTQVVCSAVLDTEDGQITRVLGVQVWDE